MTNDFKPSASIEMLKQRARLLQSIRQFFDQRDFFEVETPILSHDVVVDQYLEPIPIHVAEIGIGDTERQMMWLQTSPEFSMKRLLAAGAEAIYQITHAFRAGEVGAQHNTEFAMLEWYRLGDDMQAGMSLLAEFAETVLQTESCELISYRDVFQRYAGIDPFSDDISVLANSIVNQQIDISGLAHETDIDEWRNLLLTHLVEPQLGIDRPVIVYDWPATQSALAVVRDDDPPVAERFELYFHGVELANGFHELLDANEFAQRNRCINQQRQAAGKRALPEESRLLAAMQSGLPPCSGVALGFDRLLMVATGGKSIEDVMAFPVKIA